MVTLVKLLIVIFATLLADTTNTSGSIGVYSEPTKLYGTGDTSKHTDRKAFQILENKCNVCHYKRNQRRVFTRENMNAWSNDIYRQVFVKKRMPKGKKIKLTPQEYQQLLTWITSTKTNGNGNKI